MTHHIHACVKNGMQGDMRERCNQETCEMTAVDFRRNNLARLRRNLCFGFTRDFHKFLTSISIKDFQNIDYLLRLSQNYSIKIYYYFSYSLNVQEDQNTA